MQFLSTDKSFIQNNNLSKLFLILKTFFFSLDKIGFNPLTTNKVKKEIFYNVRLRLYKHFEIVLNVVCSSLILKE